MTKLNDVKAQAVRQMSTALTDAATMIHRGAPRCIHTDEELREYTEALFALTEKA